MLLLLHINHSGGPVSDADEARAAAACSLDAQPSGMREMLLWFPFKERGPGAAIGEFGRQDAVHGISQTTTPPS